MQQARALEQRARVLFAPVRERGAFDSGLLEAQERRLRVRKRDELSQRSQHLYGTVLVHG